MKLAAKFFGILGRRGDVELHPSDPFARRLDTVAVLACGPLTRAANAGRRSVFSSRKAA
ncbi:hypothetical protein [Ostreiculturibacter nitratireducens]|uniref:hypothetical protein n=1 Tax=Ostreiculturibacter nitratireducens TaxID=3075226 RepID=UPI0031B62B98